MPDWCQKTIAVDLDGTLTHTPWSERYKIGDPAPHSQRVIERLSRAGWQLIVHTCRPESPTVRDWVDKHYPGCFAGVNWNPSEANRSRIMLAKPYANVYIDDAAWPHCGTPIDWPAVEADFERRGYFAEEKPDPELVYRLPVKGFRSWLAEEWKAVVCFFRHRRYWRENYCIYEWTRHCTRCVTRWPDGTVHPVLVESVSGSDR